MTKVTKAIFPVAGMGTRFLPATKAMPKEMLTVVDKPIIQYVVEEALAAGIEEFIFVTGRGKTSIENHFDKSYELSASLAQKGKDKELAAIENIIPAHCRVYYTRQGSPKGLGHAVWCAKSIIGNDPFAVLLPDDIIFTDENQISPMKKMLDLYEKTGASSALVEEVADSKVSSYGILDVDGEKVDSDGKIKVHGFVEKPTIDKAPSNLGVVGRYVLNPSIFEFLDKGVIGSGGEVQLTDGMAWLQEQEAQEFYGQLLDGRRFDCGDKFGFQQANIFYAMRDNSFGDKMKEYIKDLAKAL